MADNTYPADGSLPQYLSIDLVNQPSSQSSVSNAPWLIETATSGGKGNVLSSGPSDSSTSGHGGYGYDPFSGFHWANNVIESPSWDPSYQGQYFYYGVQIGGYTLIEPAMIGGHWASKLGQLTPSHLDVVLSADKSFYSVTSTYSITTAKGVNIGNNTYSYGPDGFKWLTVSDKLQQFFNAHGYDTVTNAIASQIASNNLVPTQVTPVSQYQTPDGTNYTVVSGTNPGKASASATGAPVINLTPAQQGATYIVTSKPIDYTTTFDPFQFYYAVMNSPLFSDDSKAYFSKMVSMTTGDSGSGKYPALVASFLSYGLQATFSGETISPNRTDGFAYTAGLRALTPDEISGMTQLIQSGAAGGIPSGLYSCFLTGSIIRIEHGEKAVEDLRVGDKVCVLGKDGQTHLQSIVRLEKKHCTAHPNWPDSSAGWPVLITKGAFGANVPSHDLRVTSEHCFYFEDRFVPIRMLVNGQSIRYDYSLKEYTYYHFVTESHSVIWANDTLTESWLDTETLFHEDEDGSWHPYQTPLHTSSAPFSRQSNLKRLQWGKDSARPLCVDRSFVEPLYQKIAQRCSPTPYLAHTRQAARHTPIQGDKPYLQLTNGAIIHPLRRNGRFLIFSLPSNIDTALWFCSSTSCPNEAIGPFVDDRRSLGRLIGHISLWQGSKEIPLTSHFTSTNLPGWAVCENGPHRWTTGHAALILPKVPMPVTSPYLLSIEILAGEAEEHYLPIAG